MTIRRRLGHLLASAAPTGMNFEDWKPIVRCAIAAWIGLILILVPRTLKVLGQASFLALVVSAAQPPSGPIVKVLYDSIYNLTFVCLSWAWYVVASRAAVAARTHVYTADSLAIPNVDNYLCSSTPSECFTAAIFNGDFIEGRSSVVYAVFLYIGAVFYLYIKVKYPVRNITVILAFISLIVPVAYGPLFPYWYPLLGQVFFIPMACQSAIHIACAVLIWPRSMNHEYTQQIQRLLGEIQKITTTQGEILSSDPRNTEEWSRHAAIKDQVRAVRTGLAAFGTNEDLLIREFQYGRLSAQELRSLTTACRDVILKLGGFSLFYDLVTHHTDAWQLKVDSGIATSTRPSTDFTEPNDSHESLDLEKTTPGEYTPSPSGAATPLSENESSEESSAGKPQDSSSEDHSSRTSEHPGIPKRRESHEKRHAHFKNSKPPKHSLLHEALHHVYKPVGVFEMHDYTEREAKFPRKAEVDYLIRMMAIVSDTTRELFEAVLAALKANSKFLELLNKHRFFNTFLFRRKALSNSDDLKIARDALHHAVDEFKRSGRLAMLEPYSSGHIFGKTPYRPLTRMFYLEFHLIRFAESTLKLTQRCVELDDQHPRARWHYPAAFFAWEFGNNKNEGQRQSPKNEADFNDEADEAMLADDNYQTEVRDPDHEPPRTWFHLLGYALVRIMQAFQKPLFFFALKSAVVIVIVAIPAFLRETAGWFYHQRGLWAIIMVSFTQAPFTGDVVFSFLWRIIGTFFGACCGTTMWYMGNGNGHGQPYGLAAVMAPAFVILLYIRLRWVYINPQPAIILVLTNALIIGYSWQDSHLPSAVNFGVGWNVAWRRFVVVCIGISIAFIWTFVPRPVTGRQVIRRKLAAGAFDIGNIFVAVSNFARNPSRMKSQEEDIRQMVIRANSKLLVLNLRLQFARYEPPIQGAWPKDKYQQILSIQRELLDLLVAFANNLVCMNPEWTEPLLRRTGWHDRDLMSDCLAILFMTSNAIKTGGALPQLVPSPLIDRFYDRLERLQESDTESLLPKVLTKTTLENPGYASFAVGSVISAAIVLRIDRLLLVAKELVGECWHIDANHFENYHEYQRVNVV